MQTDTTRVQLAGRDLEAARAVVMVGLMDAYNDVQGFVSYPSRRWRMNEVLERLELLGALGFDERSALQGYGWGSLDPQHMTTLRDCAEDVARNAQLYLDDDGTDYSTRPVLRLQRQLAHRVRRALDGVAVAVG